MVLAIAARCGPSGILPPPAECAMADLAGERS